MRKTWLFYPAAAAAGVTPTSIDFNGTDEWMRGAFGGVGIANVWSISCWWRLKDLTGLQTVLECSKSASEFENWIWLHINLNDLRIRVCDSAEANIVYYQYTNVVNQDTWYHTLFTWDGNSNAFKMYIDGTDTAKSLSFGEDLTKNQTDSDRYVTLGAAADDNEEANAYISHTAMWDTILDQDDVDQIFADKLDIDLSSNSGTYDKSANLVNYWRIGNDSADIGKNEGSGSIDLMDNASNITSADIETSIYPGA